MKCDYCGREAQVVTGEYLYPARPDLAGQTFFRCDPCDAHVGCHRDSGKPLGRLANKELRRAKQAAHDAFDPLWRNGPFRGRYGRQKAYVWLSRKMGIKPEKTHIGMFDVEQCRRVVTICRNKMAQVNR